MPIDEEAEHYYLRRQREALAMSKVAAEPSVQKIHAELAQRYASLAGGGDVQSGTVLDPSAVVILNQMVAVTRSGT